MNIPRRRGWRWLALLRRRRTPPPPTATNRARGPPAADRQGRSPCGVTAALGRRDAWPRRGGAPRGARRWDAHGKARAFPQGSGPPSDEGAARGAAERRRAGRDKRPRSRLRRTAPDGKADPRRVERGRKQAFGASGARSNGLRWGVDKAEARAPGAQRPERRRQHHLSRRTGDRPESRTSSRAGCGGARQDGGASSAEIRAAGAASGSASARVGAAAAAACCSDGWNRPCTRFIAWALTFV